ncbi:transcriptional regulator [Citrobacter freundii complex sp. CFNIH2]|uniref:LacI family DNA-binding transcriptional regulator n=1 Tax=Citrobacter freundii complex sp. CFNIH2 TaxID=2066049 RepID=UPI000C86C1FE|nr:LacI family DNA-binding transcriptional regulator [Citrobacter freundii complex sp. CFNIH2]AUO66005.1 transcriptional regulator [Citrobacter freundii complex sp. CFNIH2]
MVTMSDIAKQAGVSKSTVSRVISGNTKISKATRDIVMKAINETGYRPNLVARNLAVSCTKNIGLMVANTLYNGPYFSELIYQIATVTEEFGGQLILADGKHSNEQERQAIDFLMDLQCDGIIVYSRYLSIKELEEIVKKYKKPVLIFNRKLNDFKEFAVSVNHRRDTYNAVNYLVSHGHRDIFFISGPKDSQTGSERLTGFTEALKINNIPFNKNNVCFGDWSMESGRKAMNTLFAHMNNVTSIIASNDYMAIGAANSIYEKGLRIPGDMSIVSFDDIPVASFFVPPLTTFRVPVDAMVKLAIEQLINMINQNVVNILPSVDGILIERKSVGPGPFNFGIK